MDIDDACKILSALADDARSGNINRTPEQLDELCLAIETILEELGYE